MLNMCIPKNVLTLNLISLMLPLSFMTVHDLIIPTKKNYNKKHFIPDYVSANIISYYVNKDIHELREKSSKKNMALKSEKL